MATTASAAGLKTFAERVRKMYLLTTAIAEEAELLLADMSEGYPHFLQQFGHCAFEVDSDNRIYVCDTHNSRVQILQYVGDVPDAQKTAPR